MKKRFMSFETWIADTRDKKAGSVQ